MNIIAIWGPEGAGKDTVADLIISKNSSFEHLKFASFPSWVYQTFTGLRYSELERKDKELEREKFKNFCEALKPVFGEDVWAKKLLEKIPPTGYQRNFVISDLRFEIENKVLEEVSKKQGYRLIRAHLSNSKEFEYNSLPEDFLIQNTGSMEFLDTQITNFLNHYGIS
jgi:cytidylate kinase